LTSTKAPGRSPAAILLEFLGSMNLAITLLGALAVASVIGTVMRQGESYQSYIVKFGPFWFEVFKALGLYDIYGALWFLAILGFLLISTSVCIYRNTSPILRDMRQFRENVTEKSLRAFHKRAEWSLTCSDEAAVAAIAARWQARGYRLRRKDHGDHLVLAAMKGSASRLGYFFTHGAIVVICIGALVDGNLPLKFAEMAGRIRVETRDISAAEVPKASRLAPDNASFRGSVTIPEGSRVNLAFINIRDGYLVQDLPFVVELKDFRIEHYVSGQPKSFESDLVIYDEGLDQPIQQTIRVNHPLSYKGYTLYQSSFRDGGSQLKVRVWPLAGDQRQTRLIDGAINKDLDLETPLGPMTLELTDFRLFNINPVEAADPSAKKFRDFGPSFNFKLRGVDGVAHEFVNYMAPVEREGRRFFMSGVRASVAEPFAYLYLPADRDDRIDRFMEFFWLLRDEQKVGAIVSQTTEEALAAGGRRDAAMQDQIAQSMAHLVRLFAQGGYDAVMQHVQTAVPEQDRKDATDVYLKVLQNALARLYFELLQEEGRDLGQGLDERDAQFFDDAVNALGVLGRYGSPVFLHLEDFQHVQASGLEITRTPGKNVVYLGCVMLIVGVFLMFYVPHRRLWAWIARDGERTRILFAGSGHRNPLDFAKEFDELQGAVDASFKALG